MVTTKHAAKMSPASASGSAKDAPAATPATPAALTAVTPGRVLRVTHDTEYRYAARVESAQHQARLQPLATPRQQVLSFALDIEPAPESVCTEIDAFGNARASFALNQPHDALLVRSRSTVRVSAPVWSLGARGAPPPAIASPDAEHAMAWEAVRERLQFRAGQPYDAASEFVFASPHVACDPELAAYAAASFTPGRPLVQAAWDLMRRVHADFAYTPNSTDITTTALDALRLRKGVCQDFAHVMIGALRSLGLAARYVSGYLYHDELHHDRSAEGATHAWVEALLPGLGWTGFDPTNGVITGTRHIRTAVGRDYADVPPTIGTMKGRTETELQVRVRVAPSQALLPPDEEFAADEEWSLFVERDEQALLYQQEQQQQ